MFKIAPTHNRIHTHRIMPAMKKEEKSKEPEVVYILDEVTGEMREEIRYPEDEENDELQLDEGHTNTVVNNGNNLPPPTKKADNIGLVMKKNVKTSFY